MKHDNLGRRSSVTVSDQTLSLSGNNSQNQIDSDSEIQWILLDFGQVAIRNRCSTLLSACGDKPSGIPRFMTPEVFANIEFLKSSDEDKLSQ